MKNSTMKKLLSMLLALTMVFSMTMPAFAEGNEADTPEKVHTEGCILAPDHEGECQTAPAKTHTEGCILASDHEGECQTAPAKTHTEGCILAPDHEGECQTAPAKTHTEGCILAPDHEGECQTAPAKTHTEGCILAADHEGECQTAPVCTKTLDCPLTEGHEGGCEKAAADKAAAEAEAAKLAAIQAVQEMINNLPEVPVGYDPVNPPADIASQLQAITDAYKALPEESQNLIDTAKYTAFYGPGPAAVAKIGETSYATLQEAIAAATAGETIVLQADVTLADKATISLVGITLDLGGKTLTLNGEGGYLNNATLTNGNVVITTYSGDSVANGVFYVASGPSNVSGVNFKNGDAGCIIYSIFDIRNGSVLNVSNCDIAINNPSAAKDNAIITQNNGNGVLNMTNCTVTGSNCGDFLYNGEANITGCTITLSGSGVDNGINNCAVTLDNTKFTVTGAKGRGLTSYGQNIVIKNGSVVDISGCEEANIAFKDSSKDASITVDNTSTIEETTIHKIGYSGTAKVNDKTITNTAPDMLISVSDGEAKYLSKNVASDGTNNYASLKEAFDNAASGSTITLLRDINLDSMITNPTGKTITLDLDGKTITGTDTTTSNFSLIDNRGTLTVTGNGIMTLKATNDSGTSRYSAVIANNPGGKLIIENGTLEHLGGTYMAYGIDNLTNGKGTYAETVINGGTIKSTYRGIRQFLNGVEAQNILTINGGTVQGENKSIFFHDPSKNANSGTLTIKPEASLNGDVYLFVTAGSTEWPVSVSISASALKEGSEVLEGNVPDSYDVKNTNGNYGIVRVAAKLNDSDTFETLAAALAAAKDGDTVTLLDNIEVAETITINNSLTLDLNGKNITAKDSIAGPVIKNEGTLTIMGSGIIDNTAASAETVQVVDNTGTLIINGGTYKGTNSTYSYTLRNFGTMIINSATVDGGFGGVATQTGGNTTIKDGSFCNLGNGGGHAVYLQANATMSIEGGSFVDSASASQYAIYANENSTVKIKAGSFSGADSDTQVLFCGKGGFDVTGGSFTGTLAVDSNTRLTISGGSYSVEIPAKYLAPNYIPVLNSSGRYEVKVSEVAIYDADNNFVKNAASLSDAFNAAQNGYTIKLLKDISLNEIITNTKEVTLDLNGKTVTGTDTTTTNFSLIDNRGTLTVTGNGTMTLTATTESNWGRYSAVIANNPGGKLIIENGSFKHLGGTKMSYGIDNLTNGTGTYAETVINGGSIESSYIGIRQFLNGVEAQNILTINGGTVQGNTGSLFFQDPNKNANTGTLSVKPEASLNGTVYLSVTEGSTEWPVTVSIPEAALKNGSQISSENVPENYAINKVNGTYGVYNVGNNAAILSNGNAYESLEAALADAQRGDTITLLKDATINAPLSVTMSLTIEGNGHTLTVSAGSDRAIDVPNTANGANLTVKDLTIDASKSQRGINYNTTGSLTLENVDVTAANYAVNLPGSAIRATVSISDSELNGLNTLNIWGENSNITVTDTDINTYDNNSKEDYSPIAINNDLTTAATGATITLNGGSVNYYEDDKQVENKIAVSNNAGATVTNNGCDVNGRIASYIAIGEVYDNGSFYALETIQEAVDYSIEYNETVSLLGDVVLNDELVVKGSARILLNGKNFSIGDSGKITFAADAPADSTLTLDGFANDDAEAEKLSELRAALPELCVSKGSIIIKASHTGGTATCTAKAICDVCKQPYGDTVPHDYTYSVDSTNPNVINESCSNCTTHKATASIQLKKNASTVYTGNAITPFEVSYSGSSTSQWQGGELSITYANNTEPGTATASITKGTATASKRFTIEPAELKMWEHNDYHRESGKGLSFTIKTDGRYVHHIASVKITIGKNVTELSYSQFSTTVKDGDIVLTIDKNTMAKLGVGRYTLDVEMAAKDSDTVYYYSSDAFRVRYPLVTPPTGDSANFLLWGGLLMGASIALGGSLIILKKGRKY